MSWGDVTTAMTHADCPNPDRCPPGSRPWKSRNVGNFRGGGGRLQSGARPSILPPVPEHPLAAASALVGVSDPCVLAAVRAVPRASFVPGDFASEADRDRPIAIPHGQVTTQPSLVATMVEALSLSGSERVLEIGTGYGWQTALLARLSAQVWSVERWDDLAETARVHLARHRVDNAVVVVGDGSEGLAEHAPYDAVLVSAAFPEVPPPLVAQLAAGGRLVQPIGTGGDEDVILFRKHGDVLERVKTVAVARFVPLIRSRGFRA